MAGRFLRRLTALFSWNFRDRDMDQEMTFHVESLAHEYMESGMGAEDAERAARRRFGSILQMKERGHDIRRAPAVEDIVRDFRYALRGLRRAPGFAAAVVLTLALGIGGNTAIFSVVDQLLLRPLPYPDGEQLVVVYESTPQYRARVAASPGSDVGSGARSATSPRRPDASPANWLDWQRQSRTFRSFAAWVPADVFLRGLDEPLRLKAQLVSSEFFPLLGVRPLLGRTISADDDRPKAPRVAVISHTLWQSRFGGGRGVIGRSVLVNGQPTTIVGVMPDSFRFVYQDNDLWGAFQLDRDYAWREREGRFINVVGRLQPGVTMAAADTEMRAIASRLADTHAFNTDTSVDLVPLREELTGQVHTSLLVLYGAVGVLLSIACFNVANLLLARAAARRREIAIRTSLGAGRLAIVRQLIVESVVLAVIGGALGVGLAHWSLDALVAFAPPDLLRVPDLYVDRRVMFYALGLSLLTGVSVGMVPALSVARRSLAVRMRASGSNVTQSPRVRQALVVCQVAMTVILLCGAGLLIRTVLALDRSSNGFDKRNMLTMEVALPPARFPPERLSDFFRQAGEALTALPGVEAVAAANSLPVIGRPQGGTSFNRLGAPVLPSNERPSTVVRVVTPGYFRTLGIPIRRGREFTDADRAGPAGSFVINEAFAKAYLQGIDPLTVSLSVNMQDENPHLPVIGVAGDVSEGSIRSRPQPTVYYNLRQMPAAMTLFVRTRTPEQPGQRIADAVRAVDPAVLVTRMRTLESAFGESVARERLNALVSGAFALSGLLLAALGLYGLLAFLVTERTKEIGIRIALGASLRGLTRSVIGGGIRLVALGAVIGVGGALLLSRLVGPLLFGVTPYDPATYATVLALLGTVAVWASYLPARRAARVEPLVALRQE
jgi:putative ABC transport system permease protein